MIINWDQIKATTESTTTTTTVADNTGAKPSESKPPMFNYNVSDEQSITAYDNKINEKVDSLKTKKIQLQTINDLLKKAKIVPSDLKHCKGWTENEAIAGTVGGVGSIGGGLGLWYWLSNTASMAEGATVLTRWTIVGLIVGGTMLFAKGANEWIRNTTENAELDQNEVRSLLEKQKAILEEEIRQLNEELGY